VPAGFSPGSVTFVSTGTGFSLGAAAACGTRCAAALVRTQDGGSHWVGLTPPPARYVPSNEAAGKTGPAVSEVRFADPLDGWAYGPSLFATHDGGRTWKAVGLGGAVVALETSGGYVDAVVSPCAPGRSCTGSYRLDQAPAGGGSFATVLTGPSQRADTADSAFLSLQRSSGFVLLGYGAPTGDALYATGNLADPHGWNRFPDPCAGTGLGLTSFVAPDTKHLYSLCSGNPAAGSTEKAVVVTLDGRSRVAGRPPTGGDGGTITATPAGVVLIGSYSAATMLYRSTDGGAAWRTARTFADGGEGVFDLGFTTGTQGVVIHGLPGGVPGERGTLLMTHDAGATWRAVAF
jgi:hypothetical protein